MLIKYLKEKKIKNNFLSKKKKRIRKNRKKKRWK